MRFPYPRRSRWDRFLEALDVTRDDLARDRAGRPLRERGNSRLDNKTALKKHRRARKSRRQMASASRRRNR